MGADRLVTRVAEDEGIEAVEKGCKTPSKIDKKPGEARIETTGFSSKNFHEARPSCKPLPTVLQCIDV
jgi:hypothetical protein